MAVSSSSAIVVETGVSPRASRRRFTVEYKTWVVQEAERCREAGEIGGLLRREGLFSSQLTMWRKQYKAGVRHALSQKRGPKSKRTVETSELARMQRENEQLRQQLARAELLIGIQKKLAELMGTPLPDASGERT
jgi:transposase